MIIKAGTKELLKSLVERMKQEVSSSTARGWQEGEYALLFVSLSFLSRFAAFCFFVSK
jgi:hypothetical protein